MATEAEPDRVAVGSRSGGLTCKQMYQHASHASPALPMGLFASAWAGVPFGPVSYRLADDRLRALVEQQAPPILPHPDEGGRRTAGIPGIDQMSTGHFLRLLDARTDDAADWDAEGSGPAVRELDR